MPSVAAEMGEIVALAGDDAPTVEARIARAARRLGIGFARARAFHYGLARLVPAEEADRLRAARARLLGERMAALAAEQTRIARALAALEDTHAGNSVARAPGVLDGGARDAAERAMAGPGAPLADARDALAVGRRA